MGTLLPVIRALNKSYDLREMWNKSYDLREMWNKSYDLREMWNKSSDMAVMLLGATALNDTLHSLTALQTIVGPYDVASFPLVQIGMGGFAGTWEHPVPRLPLVRSRATVGTLEGDLRILLDEGYTEGETAAALEHLVSFFSFGRVFGGDWPDFNGPAPRWRWVVRTLLDRERWRLRATGDAAGVPVEQVHERLMRAVRSEGSRFLAAAPDLHGGALIQAGSEADGGAAFLATEGGVATTAAGRGAKSKPTAWVDTVNVKLPLLRELRRAALGRRVTLGFVNACEQAGIDPKTVRTHAPELRARWDDVTYDR